MCLIKKENTYIKNGLVQSKLPPLWTTMRFE